MATNKCGTNVEGHNGGLGAVPLVGSRGKATGQWSGEQSHKFLFTYQTLHLNTLKSSKNQRKTKATFVPKLTHFGRDAVGRILAFHRPHVGRVLCTLYYCISHSSWYVLLPFSNHCVKQWIATSDRTAYTGSFMCDELIQLFCACLGFWLHVHLPG